VRGAERILNHRVSGSVTGVFVNYTSQQFRLQAAMCLERAAAQSDEALRADWLESAEHLLALSGECARTRTLGRTVTREAEASELQTESAAPRRAAVEDAAVSGRA